MSIRFSMPGGGTGEPVRARPVPCWTTVHGYDRLLGGLGRLDGAVVDDGSPAGRDLDADVVAVPYDFRLGMRDAAEQLERDVMPRLARRWPAEADRERRVIVVAHSLGGLVARHWMGVGGGPRWCRALVTLGTPHGGAPKALDVLANGVRLPGGLRWVRPVPVLREWPAAHELLPRYPAVADLTRAVGGEHPRVRSHELPLGWLRGPAGRAFAEHEAIRAAWEGMAGRRPAVLPRIGYGHAVTVTKDAPPGEGLGRWAGDLGDGTVPAYSGLPVELDQHAPAAGHMRMPSRHGPIAASDDAVGAVVCIVQAYEGLPVRSPIEAPAVRLARPVTLGLDVEEVQLAGQPVALSAWFTGDAEVPAGLPVVASLVPVGARPAPGDWVRLDADGAAGQFAAELAPRSPGLYELRARAREVPGAGDVETVEVVDGDQLG
jgi:Lecithin:cholesterol acyltransferase